MRPSGSSTGRAKPSGSLKAIPTERISAAALSASSVALQTDDADKAAAEMRSVGIALSEPLGFARPVELPDGRIGEAAFRTRSAERRGGEECRSRWAPDH